MRTQKIKTEARIIEVPISLIRSNPLQPRVYFDEEGMELLTRSIITMGIIEPLTVCENEEHSYTLLSGERRLRAAQRAGIERVPCILLDTVTTDKYFSGFVHDIQTKKLNCFEEAMVIEKLCSLAGSDYNEACDKLGIPQEVMQKRLRLLQIPVSMRKTIIENGLTEKHINLLLRLQSDSDKETLLREIIIGRLTVSQAEKKCNEIKQLKRKKHGTIIKYFNDITVFVNSIEKTVNTMLSSGIGASCKRRETESSIDFLISIPK